MSLKPFTVVLLRPPYMSKRTETPYGKDIYVANVMAEDSVGAVNAAQAEVFIADTKDKLKPFLREEYELCVLFEGHHEPKLFGWQT